MVGIAVIAMCGSIIEPPMYRIAARGRVAMEGKTA